ncbi:3-dehydroquinate synthase [Cutibacterium sp.]|uniref:3-dehydroquinate synthase family protein n=1 Tax=Cutibacterium sp. TaxID=1912221 RepID=UPI0026DB0387|nr:3-dehydroquinate synthase family protein [Cutibacterium sp.]MDO4411982.1 3-dehydroquinate synthase family protein [Cutibacterium sp.]
MNRVEVATAHPYQVLIGSRAVEGLVGLVAGRRVAVVCPQPLLGLVDRLRLDDPILIEVPDAEAAKTPQVLVNAWQDLAEAGMTRGDIIVGLGGGATTDLAGFLAATWMRGVDVIQIPTTVLAMADAAIGGKTGINIPAGKNLVGAFHEPTAVLCDTDLLTSLPIREVRSGLAEIVKCGFINDPVILDVVEGQDVLDVTSQAFVEVLTRAVEVKAGVVSDDLHERISSHGRVGRERLNYGHTLAHAVEAHEHFTWRHGEADAVGMVFAAELSRRYLGLSDEVVARTRAILSGIGLPITFDEVEWADLRETMNLDKKTRLDPETGRRILRFVGISKPGEVAMIVDPNEDVLVECYERLQD